MTAVHAESCPVDSPTSFPNALDTTATASYGISDEQTAKKDVVIRQMVLEDSDFVGSMIMEAFRDKMQTLVGEKGMPEFLKANQEYHKHLTDRYHRFFIAEIAGERAGMIQLGYKKDGFKEPADFNWGDYVSGCCNAIRAICISCIEPRLSAKDKEMYVAIIAVDPKFRGCGVGKALLDRAEVEGRALGCKAMSLDVTTTNRARSLYLRQGYVIANRMDGCCCTWIGFGVRYFYRMEKQL